MQKLKAWSSYILGAVLIVLAILSWQLQPRHDGETIHTWLARLDDDEATMRLRAVEAVAKLVYQANQPAKVIAGLTRLALHDADERVCKLAGEKLCSICGIAVDAQHKRQAAETLLAGLQDTSAAVRARAAGVLIDFFSLHLKRRPEMTLLNDEVTLAFEPKVLAALAAALGDPDRAVRQRVLAGLTRVPNPLPGGEAALLALYAEGDQATKVQALDVLTRVTALSEQAAPVLVQGLLRKESVWAFCSQRLSRMGDKAVPPLVGVLSKSKELHDEGAIRAMNCLKGIGQPAVPAVLQLLRSGAKHARDHALHFLEFTKDGHLVLIGLLKDDDAVIRGLATERLYAMGRQRPYVRAALTAAQQQEDERMRNAAAAILQRIETSKKNKGS